MHTIKKYELVAIRCRCNTPIGHLHEDYKMLLKYDTPERIFDQMGVKNPCCRAALALPTIRLIDKPDNNLIEGKSKDNKKPSKLATIPTNITEVNNDTNNKEIYRDFKPTVPISYKLSQKTKKLNYELSLNYVDHHTYIAF